MTSFFAISENPKSAESINFDINRKKIENLATPYKKLIFLKQWLKSYYELKVLMTSSKWKGKKHVFKDVWLLARQGVQTSKRDKQYHSSECFLSLICKF